MGNAVLSEKLNSIVNDVSAYIKENDTLPPLTAAGNISVKDLMDIIYYLLKEEKPEWNFAPAYPSYINWNIKSQRDFTIDETTPTETFKPTITYRIVREMPAGFAGPGEPFSGYRNLTAILKEENKEFIGNKEQIVQTSIKAYETLIQFELWDIVHDNLDRMYEWFRTWLTNRRGLFRYLGIENCFYWGGGEFTNDQHLNKQLNRRSMLYYVRSQEIFKNTKDEILKQVNTTIEVLKKNVK